MIRILINIVLLFFISNSLFAQGDVTPPDAPDIIKVEVDIQTGKANIYWTPSPSPDVAGYYIFKKDRNGYNKKYDTVPDPTAVHYVDEDDTWDATMESLTYSVSAYDSSDNEGPMDVPMHQTIRVFPYIETCNRRVNLDWNAYQPDDEIIGYRLYYHEQGTNYNYTLLTTLDKNTTNYFVEDVDPSTSYSAYIEAYTESGVTITSNSINFQLEAENAPAYIYNSSVSMSENNQVRISFLNDTTGETDLFRLYRATNYNGPYKQIKEFTATEYNNQVSDFVDSKNTVYFYKLVAVDNCGIEVQVSNISSNIVLTSESNNNYTVGLNWNKYITWDKGVDKYNIYRITDNEEPMLVGTTNSLTNSFTDNIQDVIINNYYTNLNNYNNNTGAQNMSGKICYYIEAIEDTINSSYQSFGKSTSNIICETQKAPIYVPNCFNPNSANVDNKTFKPLICYGANNYNLTIYDRWGNKVFESSNVYKGWDGTTKSGKKAKEGTYVYYIIYTDPEGEIQELSGNVTLLFKTSY